MATLPNECRQRKVTEVAFHSQTKRGERACPGGIDTFHSKTPTAVPKGDGWAWSAGNFFGLH